VAPESSGGVGWGRTGMAPLIAAMMAGLVVTTSVTAHAQDAPTPEAPAVTEAAAHKAECAEKLAVAERYLEKDYRYARGWTDSWYVVAASLAGLSLNAAFTYHDYRRGEQLASAFQSLLLIIQLPTALTTKRTLAGLQTAAPEDPCLALTNARNIFEVNHDDYVQHTKWFNYVIAGAIPVFSGAIVGLASRHWDFAGHGAEGLGTVIGFVAGELQLITFPQGSLNVGAGTGSLTMQF
jgi:hypothetical protein